MTVRILSSAPIEEIRAYLKSLQHSSQPGASAESAAETFLPEGSLTVSLRDGGMHRPGNMEWPLTEVEFQGEPDVCRRAVERFRLAFLTAGG